MAYIFGDGFDCYTTTNDFISGYWDSGALGFGMVAGRFAGSRAIDVSNFGGTALLTKSSGVNDSVHHIVCAYRQTANLTGTGICLNLQLSDGVTGQVAIVFRADGAILLTSGSYAGATLATYTGATTAQNTWFAYEFEVVIHNTAGSFTVRKNGNPSNDFTIGSINTRGGTANNYANRLSVAIGSNLIQNQQLDDLLWRSDASSVPWIGDVRCYTRMPTTDGSVQFARSPATITIPVVLANSTTVAITTGTARYQIFTVPTTAPAFDGTIGSVTVQLNTGYTGTMKCSMFANGANVPTTLLGSATPVVNPVTGVNTFTFGTPVAVTKGTSYWLGFSSDTSAGAFTAAGGTSGFSSTTAYAAFPVASPSGSGDAPLQCTQLLTPLGNASLVSEAQQDGASTYVFDSTVGHADFYNIASIAATPASTIAVITRAFAEKLDAGFRQVTVQVKSGGTTVQATPQSLSNNFGWIYRADTVDPATGVAWTPAAVNALQVGPRVTG